jgi:hypothetical protein
VNIGFFVWNPFQIYQFESIVRNCPGATYIVEKRKSVNFDLFFPKHFLEKIGAPIQIVSRRELAQIDGLYDAIVCQTAFAHMEKLKSTKIVGMQYSMSKERHQYGAWRILCDLNLVYGKYSFDRIGHYGPSIMVGNPRFDPWFSSRLDSLGIDLVRDRLSPLKKTVLYLPTWGNLSSMTLFGDAIAALAERYNLIAKVHHKTDSHEVGRKTALGEGGIENIFGASDDLLSLLRVSDLVISDYSGAIFDAINVGKPVVLLQHNPDYLAEIGAEKFGLESLEYAGREMIGPVVSAPDALESVISEIFSGKLNYAEQNKSLKSKCFAFERDCGLRAANAIIDLVKDGTPPRPYHQLYTRDLLRDYRQEIERAKVILARKNYKKSIIVKLLTAIRNFF